MRVVCENSATETSRNAIDKMYLISLAEKLTNIAFLLTNTAFITMNRLFCYRVSGSVFTDNIFKSLKISVLTYIII